MAVDDDKIEEISDFVTKKLKECAEIQTVYGNLHSNLVSIKKRTKTIQNKTGGTDNIEEIPNDNKLNDSDNNKIRQIIYDNCITQYTKLKSSA